MENRVKKEIIERINGLFDILNLDGLPSEKITKIFPFQGRKSIFVAKEVISNIGNDKTNILDPFFGTGAFLFASAMNKKNTFGIELDNFTFFIVDTLLKDANLDLCKQYFERVMAACKDDIMELYVTKCTCGKANYINKLFFDPETAEYYNPERHREITDGCNIKYIKTCSCGKKAKKFDSFDEDKINEVNKINTARFPHHSFIINSRINITESTGANIYDRNFTNRAKAALLRIQDEILCLPASVERDILEIALASSISLAKICMYGSSTDNLYHVIRFKAQETNVWEVFETKVDDIIKYKKYLNYECGINSSNVTIINKDYYSELIQDKYQNKFDVIYTDPPYTDQAPYLEKNQYFRDWLRCFYDRTMILSDYMLEKEIVVSNAESRKEKDFDHYFRDLDHMFSVFYKVLKSDSLLFFTLKLGERKYFSVLTSFINLARKNGFEYINRIAVENVDPTVRKQAAFANTLTTQYIVCFAKIQDDQYWYIEDENMDFSIKKYVYNRIKSDRVLLFDIEREIVDKIRNNYSYICDDLDLEKIRKIIKRYFYVDENAFVRIDPDGFYVGLEEKNELFTKLYDIVPVLIKKILKKQSSFVIDDLYFEISNLIYDGSNLELYELLLEDTGTYKNQLINIINNYCDVSNDRYISKSFAIESIEGRIDVSSMDPYEFEELTKALITKMGYTNASRVGGAGDRGIDVIATNRNGTLTFFQCKRWIGGVGGEPIQRLHSQMVINTRVTEAICITTSYYTTQGMREAESTGVKTINGFELITLLDRYYPNKYYNGAIKLIKED